MRPGHHPVSSNHNRSCARSLAELRTACLLWETWKPTERMGSAMREPDVIGYSVRDGGPPTEPMTPVKAEPIREQRMECYAEQTMRSTRLTARIAATAAVVIVVLFVISVILQHRG